MTINLFNINEINKIKWSITFYRTIKNHFLFYTRFKIIIYLLLENSNFNLLITGVLNKILRFNIKREDLLFSNYVNTVVSYELIYHFRYKQKA